MPEEELAPGMTIERDIDGTYKKVTLSPERAAAMGRRSHGAARDESVDRLLTQRGINPNEADEGLLALARVAVGGRSGAVGSLRYLDMITGYFKPQGETSVGKPQPGEVCPTCGCVVAPALSADAAQMILDILAARDESESAPASVENP